MQWLALGLGLGLALQLQLELVPERLALVPERERGPWGPRVWVPGRVPWRRGPPRGGGSR